MSIFSGPMASQLYDARDGPQSEAKVTHNGNSQKKTDGSESRLLSPKTTAAHEYGSQDRNSQSFVGTPPDNSNMTNAGPYS